MVLRHGGAPATGTIHEPFASRFALQAGARVTHRQGQLTAGTNLCLQIVP